ncbi:MAG: alpha-amylase family glycosyl hydrolase, partial [Pseudoalteromonas spongiae]
MKKKMYALFALIVASNSVSAQSKLVEEQNKVQKPVVYQVFTRLFGNTNTTNKPWGSKAENGVGKFADFTPKALNEIKDMGVSHIWYTGVLHHAMAEDYTQFGISLDDPDVIKGRAGSPYAIKDYYSVNPDLANNPAKRIEEFEALIKRSHAAGLKVIIDIVPNHVARRYESIAKPKGVIGLGEKDDTSVTYSKFNDFYYIPGAAFSLPKFPEDYSPLGGDAHPLVDGKFDENPAKWTGNGSREAQPNFNDWYETVKVNYGVKPDGSYDFATLPSEYATKSYRDVVAFWQGKELPSSWHKMRDIAFYWLDKGVDGFRYDMAEMVPVEFWSYLNAHIKTKNPEATLIAEVYNPTLYRDYIHLGKMDYLYDKVGFYDTLKW